MWLKSRPYIASRNCVDLTIVSTLTVTNLLKTAKKEGGGSSILTAASLKRNNYEERCHEKGHDFTPFVIETTGGFGSEALAIMDRIGRCKSQKELLLWMESRELDLQLALQACAKQLQ